QSVTHRVELSGKLIFDVTDKSRQRRDRVRQCVELFFYRGRPQRSFRLFSDQTSICHCSPACCCRNDYSAQYSFSGVVTAQHSCRAKATLLEMARTGRSSAFKLANSASRLGAGFWFGRDARGQISVSPLIAAELGDVDVQYVWRFLRAQKIDLAARKSWCESN